MTTTPTTPEGLRRYDHLPALNAVVAAWTEPGQRPEWHEKMRERVRLEMPLLARALDRAAAERQEAPARSREPQCSDPRAEDGCPWDDHDHDPKEFRVVDGEWRYRESWAERVRWRGTPIG